MSARKPLVLNGALVEALQSGDVLQLLAAIAGAASLNIPHGTAPTSPQDGDMWTTTAGLFARINGATVGPYGTAGSSVDKARVYLSATVSTTTAGWQKVPIDTVDYDTNSIWNASSKRFIPKQAGYYMVDLRVRVNTTAGISTVAIGKNGSQTIGVGADSGGQMLALGGSSLIYCNGSTDYLELMVFSIQVRTITTGSFDTWMTVTGPF